MGDAADDLLNGRVDAMGEYTGKNYGYPVYPKGWFGKQQADFKKVNHGNKVFNFLKTRNIVGHEAKVKIVLEYASNEQILSRKHGKICKAICKDAISWNTFKNWIDNKRKENDNII